MHGQENSSKGTPGVLLGAPKLNDHKTRFVEVSEDIFRGPCVVIPYSMRSQFVCLVFSNLATIGVSSFISINCMHFKTLKKSFSIPK